MRKDDKMIFNKERFTYELLESEEHFMNEYLENKEMYDDLFDRFLKAVNESESCKDLKKFYTEEKILDKINEIVFFIYL